VDSIIVAYTFSQMTSLDLMQRIAFRRGRNRLMSKLLELTAKLSLNRLTKRLLLPLLDSNKREA
jgi:hypothetical protein